MGMLRPMMEWLLSPVSDAKLRMLVHCTMGVCLVAALAFSGVIQNIAESVLVETAMGAMVGVMVCLSLCKTLAHEEMPESYLRYGSYIMAFGYSVYIIGETAAQLHGHFGVGAI